MRPLGRWFCRSAVPSCCPANSVRWPSPAPSPHRDTVQRERQARLSVSHKCDLGHEDLLPPAPAGGVPPSTPSAQGAGPASEPTDRRLPQACRVTRERAPRRPFRTGTPPASPSAVSTLQPSYVNGSRAPVPALQVRELGQRTQTTTPDFPAGQGGIGLTAAVLQTQKERPCPRPLP